MTLLEVKYIMTCQECGGYRHGYGRIEVHSFLLKRRERTLAAKSAVLEMLEVKEDRRFGRLDDDSAKVKWMWRVYPRVDYTYRGRSRHRGRLLCLLGSRAKASTLRGRHIRCSVDLKPGDCELVVDGGRALQPCRYRLFTHMSCIILYPYST